MASRHSSDVVTPRMLIVDDGIGVWGSHQVILRLAPLLEAQHFTLGLLSSSGSGFSAAWTQLGLENTYYFAASGAEMSARDSRGRLSAVGVLGAAMRLTRRAFSIAKVAKEFRADIIVSNSFWTHFDVAIAGRISRRAAVLYLHEECPPGLPSTALRTAARLARASIAVSSDVARSINLPSRIRVINNGIDAVRFSPGPRDESVRRELGADPTQAIVISIGRLDESKQVDQIIRAVAALAGPLSQTQLAIVGSTTSDSRYYADLVALGEELLGDRVRFLGARHDVPDLLRNADLYVLAGRREGMPLGILEAQAVGCAVVSYPAAGVRDSVSHARTGMIATMNKWASLSETMSTVLNDAALRESIATNARSLIEERFTMTYQSNQVIALLKAAIN